jgi:hypothetical protein
VPAVFVANAAFSTVGDGAATRAGTVVIFAWIAFVSVRLLQKGETEAPALVLHEVEGRSVLARSEGLE